MEVESNRAPPSTNSLLELPTYPGRKAFAALPYVDLSRKQINDGAAHVDSRLDGGTSDTCTDARLERFDNEFNLVLDAHPPGEYP